jgi:hypothetical protein
MYHSKIARFLILALWAVPAIGDAASVFSLVRLTLTVAGHGVVEAGLSGGVPFRTIVRLRDAAKSEQ